MNNKVNTHHTLNRGHTLCVSSVVSQYHSDIVTSLSVPYTAPITMGRYISTLLMMMSSDVYNQVNAHHTLNRGHINRIMKESLLVIQVFQKKTNTNK